MSRISRLLLASMAALVAAAPMMPPPERTVDGPRRLGVKNFRGGPFCRDREEARRRRQMARAAARQAERAS